MKPCDLVSAWCKIFQHRKLNCATLLKLHQVGLIVSEIVGNLPHDDEREDREYNVSGPG